MTFADTMRLAFRNLRQAKLRTFLTTMGVAIGIASLSGMVSLGVGLQDQLVGQFMRSGMFDTITVTAGGGSPFGGRPGFPNDSPPGGLRGRGAARGRTSSASPSVTLNDDAVRTLSALEGVKEVYPVISIRLEVAHGEFSDVFTATGVPMSSRDEGVYRSMAAGTFFSGDSDESCLMSLDTAKRIDAKKPLGLVGQTLRLAYVASRSLDAASEAPATADATAPPIQIQRVVVPCRVAGIVEREAGNGLPFGGGGGSVLLPLGRIKAIRAENVSNVQSFLRPAETTSAYPSVTVKVAQAQTVQDVADRVRSLGFSAFSLADALQGAKRVFIVLNIVLSLIGSIALAVSSLGIVNTMVMSILERTREIGIMKAIGASDGDIRRIFLVEAAAIGAMGGGTGLLIGWLVGRIINLGANFYIQSQGGTPATLFSLPWWLVGGALGFAVLVSIVAGSYPANRAARLEPMGALRHE